MKQLFSFGQVVATRGVTEDLDMGQIRELLMKHGELNKGVLDSEDVKMNEEALTNQDRILNAYMVHDEKYYVITEWDRSVTTVLRAEEY